MRFSAELAKRSRQVRESLAFWPFLLSAAGAALGWLLPLADGRLSRIELAQWAWVLVRFEATSGIAQVLVSSAASTLATVLGVVFSLTIVTLQLASVQYSPRLLPRFMADRTTQRTLGAYLGTVIYLFMVLRAIRGGSHPFVPELSVTVGLGLVIFCLGLLAYFLHHLARSIQAAHLISSVGHETGVELDRPGPQSMPSTEAQEECPSTPGQLVALQREGYVQIINLPQLRAAAPKGTRFLRVLCRPGDYLLCHQPCLELWSDRDVPTECHAELSRAFALGRSRTLEGDPLFGVRQLVDVALKALSPGINDVTTALLVLNALGGVLLKAAHKLPAETHPLRTEGAIPIWLPGMGFDSLLREALREIIPAASGHARLLARILELLTEVARQGKNPAVRKSLLEVAAYLWGAVEQGHAGALERELLHGRYQALLRASPEQTGRERAELAQVH